MKTNLLESNDDTLNETKQNTTKLTIHIHYINLDMSVQSSSHLLIHTFPLLIHGSMTSFLFNKPEV